MSKEIFLPLGCILSGKSVVEMRRVTNRECEKSKEDQPSWAGNDFSFVEDMKSLSQPKGRPSIRHLRGPVFKLSRLWYFHHSCWSVSAAQKDRSSSSVAGKAPEERVLEVEVKSDFLSSFHEHGKLLEGAIKCHSCSYQSKLLGTVGAFPHQSFIGQNCVMNSPLSYGFLVLHSTWYVEGRGRMNMCALCTCL